MNRKGACTGKCHKQESAGGSCFLRHLKFACKTSVSCILLDVDIFSVQDVLEILAILVFLEDLVGFENFFT